MDLLLIIIALFLAFGNGANDNFKGCATLWGSAALSYQGALRLATAATLAGSLLSLVLASSLVQSFAGASVVAAAHAQDPHFLAAAGIGAAVTVLLATRFGLPISTTHALIGGVAGAGWAVSNGAIKLGTLGSSFVVPMVVSPVLAGCLGLAACRMMAMRRLAHVGIAQQRAAAQAAPASLAAVHIASAAAICFGRAVNDTPKLAALLIAAQAAQPRFAIVLVGVAMCLGGLMMARRVAEAMSLGLTRLSAREGVAANLITATLVLGASHFGLPVSATHVSVGSIAGVGAAGQALNWHGLRPMLLSWFATLPVAALIGWAAFYCF